MKTANSQRPCWQTAFCGREPRMVGGISIKLRMRIPCSFRKLERNVQCGSILALPRAEYNCLINSSWAQSLERPTTDPLVLGIWKPPLWLRQLRPLPAGTPGGDQCHQSCASVLVISTAVVHCAYQADWQLVSEYVNKAQAEFKSLPNEQWCLSREHCCLFHWISPAEIWFGIFTTTWDKETKA